MRIDVVTIFPAIFDALEISLLGRARGAGLLDIRVHDLRAFTHDRHRTVDDTPYGGGAGMVMKPEPWGEALDAVTADPSTSSGTEGGSSGTEGGSSGTEGGSSGTEGGSSGTGGPVIVFPSPAGEVFTQATAREFAAERHLVFGCGRYEGIDERVFEDAARIGRVRLVSLGDYVLNGGEVAAMAMIEAVGRLVPGVVGNPASLVEESHEEGLLEYPSYTKPALWRGHEVPPILLSGNHGAIASWRRDQQLERTRTRRPDLLAD